MTPASSPAQSEAIDSRNRASSVSRWCWIGCDERRGEGPFAQLDVTQAPAGSVEEHRTPQPLHIGGQDVHCSRVERGDAAFRDPGLEQRLAFRRPARSPLVIELLEE